MRFDNHTARFHHTLAAAAFLAAAVAPLVAAANPSMGSGASAGSGSGGSQRVWGTPIRSGGVGQAMHGSQWLTAPDRKIHRERFARNDWSWYEQPACNSGTAVYPQGTKVYSGTMASCLWQNAPLWIP